jgi:Dimerisation domain
MPLLIGQALSAPGDTMPKDLKIPPAKVARIVERFRHHLYRLHQRSAPAAAAAVFELVNGAWVAQAVQVAAELRIADALTEQPLPLDDLADRVDADPDALRRPMRALISRGVFRQRRDGCYDLTALANALRSDAPFSMYQWARVVGSRNVGVCCLSRSNLASRPFHSCAVKKHSNISMTNPSSRNSSTTP